MQNNEVSGRTFANFMTDKMFHNERCVRNSNQKMRPDSLSTLGMLISKMATIDPNIQDLLIDKDLKKAHPIH